MSFRIINGIYAEAECDSCGVPFTTTRGEDGEPDEILCSECKQTWQELRTEIARERGLAWKAWLELRAELARERDRVWFETFLSFPFKALPTPSSDRVLADLDWADVEVRNQEAWQEYLEIMDAADQAAYYSPKWEETDGRP